MSDKPEEVKNANKPEEVPIGDQPEEVPIGDEPEEAAAGPVYGDCMGPNSMYIKLISADDHEFIIKREYALFSSTIEAMLTGPGRVRENEINEIKFREVRSDILSKVLMYITYRIHHANWTEGIYCTHYECMLRRPPADRGFPIEPEIFDEFRMALDFFGL